MKMKERHLKPFLAMMMVAVILVAGSSPATAHCDSYDGPVVTDALKALETNNVDLVLKWIDGDQEEEITSLFNKTYGLKDGDREVYGIVKQHFLETLVRLHRETEGEPYTGLKPSGTTEKIIRLSDSAIGEGSVDELAGMLSSRTAQLIREKYEKVAALEKVKDISVEKGREYVHAYVDYTHTLKAIHDLLAHGGGHEGGH